MLVFVSEYMKRFWSWNEPGGAISELYRKISMGVHTCACSCPLKVGWGPSNRGMFSWPGTMQAGLRSPKNTTICRLTIDALLSSQIRACGRRCGDAVERGLLPGTSSSRACRMFWGGGLAQDPRDPGLGRDPHRSNQQEPCQMSSGVRTGTQTAFTPLSNVMSCLEFMIWFSTDLVWYSTKTLCWSFQSF